MVSEQKVRMMIRLAEYESHEGKQDFARTKYYKMDYIRLQILKTLVCVTCADRGDRRIIQYGISDHECIGTRLYQHWTNIPRNLYSAFGIVFLCYRERFFTSIRSVKETC